MPPLPQIKKQLRELVPVSIADALKALKDLLPDESAKYQATLALEGRLNETNKNRLLGVISDEQLQLSYNRLRKDLLDLINGLEASDFDPEAATKAAGSSKSARRGSILYRIPGTMPLGRESKCVVRIALDRETIVRNIELDEHLQLKDIRVSDIMQVELVDPSEGHPFQIRTLSSAEQFIEEGEYTEWIFKVKPLAEGVYPLMLKVAVIELIQGKERKREIVLEEEVQIVTESAVEDADEALRPAGYAFSFSSSTSHVPSTRSTSYVPSTRSTSYVPSTPLRRSALLLAALIAFTSGAWAFAPARTEWLAVRYLADNDAAYDWYIARHEGKDTPLREQAYLRKAEIQETPEKALAVYDTYLATYEDKARFREEARWEVTRLEDTPVAYLSYLREFPQAKAAGKAGLDAPQLEQKVLDQLARQSDPAELEKALALADALNNDRVRADILRRVDELYPSNQITPAKPMEEKLENPGEKEKKEKKETVPPQKDEKTGEEPAPVEKDAGTSGEEVQSSDEDGTDTSGEETLPAGEDQNLPDASISENKLGTTTLGGNTYRTVRLNGLTWMAQNLNYEVPGSWCYDDDPANCRQYGRLYTWEAAKQACRAVGWRLPTDGEWSALRESQGGSGSAYQALMEGGNTGFSALLGGSRHSDGEFFYLGRSGYYWSSTEHDADYAWYYWFYGGVERVDRYYYDLKANAQSCRCLRGAPSNGID